MAGKLVGCGYRPRQKPGFRPAVSDLRTLCAQGVFHGAGETPSQRECRACLHGQIPGLYADQEGDREVGGRDGVMWRHRILNIEQ